MKAYFWSSLLLSTFLLSVGACSSRNGTSSQTNEVSSTSKQRRVGGPQLGKPGGGPSIDKSGDAELQSMISELVPKFRQLEYVDELSGKSMKYNLFEPQGRIEGHTYPLVLFMADASTPGENSLVPLVQGYGALVWATEEWQQKHPCYVLVPQFSGVGVNDAFERTEEVDMVLRLVQSLSESGKVDTKRLYTTGQSMGGMISMYFNIAYPEVFAASLFVDSHWDTSKFGELSKHKFVYVTAGENGHAWSNIAPLEEATRENGITYAYERWSAKLPQERQDAFARDLLSRGARVNVINFSPGTVLPSDGKGSEHMYSFDYAYKLTPVLEWLFEQSN